MFFVLLFGRELIRLIDFDLSDFLLFILKIPGLIKDNDHQAVFTEN